MTGGNILVKQPNPEPWVALPAEIFWQVQYIGNSVNAGSFYWYATVAGAL